MTISAQVIEDSISPGGKRLTTMVLEYPRFIHQELLTHRMFSRNAASSRAIPVRRMLRMVQETPAMPIHWGANQPGMQAREELSPELRAEAERRWLLLRDMAVTEVQGLMDLGLHKQVANRLLEPWMHMTVVVSATEWANFFHLRRHPDAQPEMKALADCVWGVRQTSTPRLLQVGEWHLPFVLPEERAEMGLLTQRMCSVARCARVSYLNHDGTTPDVKKDMELHERLFKAPHASPFEHQATPVAAADAWSGNFQGWLQYRKTFSHENTVAYEG
jgi:thymidylate synthase ThyX